MEAKKAFLFSTAAYRYMRDAIAKEGGFPVGELECNRFPDGESYHRIKSAVADRDVILVGGTITDADTLELYDLACGLVHEGVHRLALVIPYFGYSTMERAVHPGEIVTAKNRARLLSSIPIAQSGSRVLLLDLHSEGVAYYFEDCIRPVHLYAKSVVLEAIRRFGKDDFVLACTDAGRAKWVQSLANDLGVTASFVFKRRLSGASTQVTTVSAQVDGRRVVIYDDMIRTGGTLANAARAYKDAGAVEIAAVATHGVFPGDSLQRLHSTGLFSGIACTDSHPRAVALAGDFLRVDSVVGLLAAELQQTV